MIISASRWVPKEPAACEMSPYAFSISANSPVTEWIQITTVNNSTPESVIIKNICHLAGMMIITPKNIYRSQSPSFDTFAISLPVPFQIYSPYPVSIPEYFYRFSADSTNAVGV
jgi:hypothetical protein